MQMIATKRKTEHHFERYGGSSPVTPLSAVEKALGGESPSWKKIRRSNGSWQNYKEHLQFASLKLSKSSFKYNVVKMPINESDYFNCYENQREYHIPCKLNLGEVEYRLITSSSSNPKHRRYIPGSASIVSFYEKHRGEKSRLPTRIALKTAQVFDRGCEPTKSESGKCDLLKIVQRESKALNSRWLDEWKILNCLMNKFGNMARDERPMVEIFGGILYKINDSFQASIVMEKMDSTLEHVIEKRSVDLDMLHSTVHSLQLLHSAGIIYVDLKPSNVLLDLKTGKARFSDFDCSMNTSWSTHEPDYLGGSLRYLSPERQMGSMIATYSDDFWAFGVLLAEAFTGERISNVLEFKSFSNFEEYLQKNKNLDVDQDADDILIELILHLLEKDPEDRPCMKDVEDTLMMLL